MVVAGGADLTLSGSSIGNSFGGRTLGILPGGTVSVSGRIELEAGTNAINNAGTLNLSGSGISQLFGATGSLSLSKR